MFIAIDGKLYRYKGYLTCKPELVPEYPSWTEIPEWTYQARVFVENTVLPNGCYRKRRGEWVLIPKEWVGSVPTKQTMRKRNPVSRRTRHK